jgi:hypothetical protein
MNDSTVSSPLSAVSLAAKSALVASPADVRAQFAPLFAVTTAVQQQVAVWRQTLLEAEMAAEDHDGIVSRTEALHQTIRALEKDAQLLIDTQRRIAQGMTQYQRYASELDITVTVAQPPIVTSDAPPL